MADSESWPQRKRFASFPSALGGHCGPGRGSVLYRSLGRVRQIDTDRFSHRAQSWLLLHRCVAELSFRVKQGATPGKDIVMAELFRLCRSREHPAFADIGGRFLSSLGKAGMAS